MPAALLPSLELHEVVPVAQAQAVLRELDAKVAALTREVLLAEEEAHEAVLGAEGLTSPFAARTSQLSERIVDELRAASRAELLLSLQAAQDDADARVAAARRDADAMVAAARDEVAATLLAHAPLPVVVDLTTFRGAPPSSVPHPVHEATVSLLDAQPPLQDPVEAESDTDLGFGPEPSEVASHPSVMAAHEQFWQEEAQASVERARSFAPIEALLPTLALLIVLVVVLVLIG